MVHIKGMILFRRTIAVVLFICFLSPGVTWAMSPPSTIAEAICLVDADTGRVLYGKNQDKIMYPASTTKIVTLMTALKRGDLNSTVTVSRKAANCDGSSLDLETGDQLLLKDLLYGLMLVSGNDAAEAVAEHIGGSIPTFVGWMNQEAKGIGANKTHFTNPHGLPDPINHFTTASDLALITVEAFKLPAFKKIVATREYTIAFRNKAKVRTIANTNKILKLYPGATGVKTGYTEEAGDCLVASAKRGDTELIVVILNSDERWAEAGQLLDYGFSLVQKKK